MPQPVLGIMTLSTSSRNNSEELAYFSKLSQQGRQLGVAVCVFRPDQVDPNRKKMIGWFYHPQQRRWVRKITDYPDLVYDRCRYPMQHPDRFRYFKQFRQRFDHWTYLNHPLANKWVLHKVFSEDPDIREHLPYTRKYVRFDDLQGMLQKFPVCYIKPINGTGGRGILKIRRVGQTQWAIQGREKNRRIIPAAVVSRNELVRKLHRWDVSDKYLIQQGLNLTLSNGRVHDYRVLIQKNGRGEWEMTGGAGRIGANKSVTSNLHGGGRAIPMKTLLHSRFSSPERIDQIMTTVSGLCHSVVRTLERRFRTLCEVALDIAVDDRGKVWLLEINQKPSREIFSRINEQEQYLTAIRRPLEYALYLFQSRPGRKD